MEASNSSRPRTASRSGQLRRVPAAIRRVLGRRAGVPRAAGARGGGPVLPAGGGQRGGRRISFRQHAAEASSVPVSEDDQV